MTENVPLAGVIGHPIHQSKSPQLHGHWLRRYGIRGHYIPMDVAPGDLADVIRVLPRMGFVGVNVTIPHKINVLDTAGETLTLASLHLGIPQCTSDREQLKALNALVMGAKADWASFGSDVAKDVLVSGDAAAGMIWSGFAAKARGEGAPIEYAFPEQGVIVWMDNLALLKDAPNRDSALAFLNFMLEPENAATLTNYAQYSAGVTGVAEFLDPEVANSPESNPPEGTKTVFVEACPEEVQVLYDAIWTNLKK